MLDFDDSFNFLVGSSANLDWDNNPYVRWNIYELDETWNPKLSDDIKLV